MPAQNKIQSLALSPYLTILEDEISQDLQRTIDPKDLRAGVRKTLFQEVLRQAAVAMSELSSNLIYSSYADATIERGEQKLGRHLRYVQEMLGVRDAQRIDPDHQLNAGDSEE